MLHCGVIAPGQARRFDLLRHLVAVSSGVVLHDLHAAAMAMHVAEAADVHQDVEAELLSGAERTRNFVVAAAMPQPQLDDFAAPLFGHAGDNVPDLTIRVMRVLIEQRCRQFNLQRIVVQQIDRRSILDRPLPRRFQRPPPSVRGEFRSRTALGSAYFISVGATRTSRSRNSAARSAASGESAAICFQQLASFRVAHVVRRLLCRASRSSSPRRRTSACVCDSSRETCVLQGTRADDLAQRGIGRQRQQVAREVEGAGAQGALVRILLHLSGLRRPLAQVAEHLVGEVPIFAEKMVEGFAVERASAIVISQNRERSSRFSGSPDSGWSAPARPSAAHRRRWSRPESTAARWQRRCAPDPQCCGGRTESRRC